MSKKKEIVSKGIEDDGANILSEDIIVEMADNFIIEEIDGGVKICVAELKEDESCTAPSTIFDEAEPQEEEKAAAEEVERDEQADAEHPEAEEQPTAKLKIKRKSKKAVEKQQAEIQTYRVPRNLLNS